MTDYYPLLVKAIAGLDKSTGEARRVLYDRARSALLAQLRGVDPPLSEPEITRERLALEEAVRKVEAESARQVRFAAPRESTPAVRSDDPQREGSTPRGESALSSPRPEREASRAGADDRDNENPRGSPPRRDLYRNRPYSDRQRSGDEGVRGLRDVVAEAESLGAATAQAARSAREAYGAAPSDDPALDRVEPRAEPEDLRSPVRDNRRPPIRPRAPAPSSAPSWAAPQEPAYPEPPPLEEVAEPDSGPRHRTPGPMPRRVGAYDRDDEPANPARRGLIAAILSVLIIAGLGGAGYWQRERVAAWFGAVKGGFAPQAQRDPAQTRPKDAGRIGQDGQPATQPGARPGAPPPAVAQRVVLYEQDTANPDGKRYFGSALWRLETISPGPGLSPELAIRADVEVPERRFAMTMSIRRNADPALSASSHTIEIIFNLPADFASGGVANVPGLMMKEQEEARGAPLAGLAVKVTNGFFLIGLSAVESDLQRNLQLLQERSWFDIPVVYNDGRRAILAIEKGNPGERVFKDAFAAWSK